MPEFSFDREFMARQYEKVNQRKRRESLWEALSVVLAACIIAAVSALNITIL